jgi:hypothetical protein
MPPRVSYNAEFGNIGTKRQAKTQSQAGHLGQ